MTEGDIHTEPHNGGWANKVEGKARVSSTHKTKLAAEHRGRETASLRKVDHVIHKGDGTIAKRNSYGTDPPGRPI